MKPTRGNQKSKTGKLMLAMALLLAGPVLAQNIPMVSPKPARPKRQVLVSIPDRKLALVENGTVLKVFPVAVGAAVSQSPTGQFQIVNRIANPTYYHPGMVVPPSNDNPVGTRWIGLNKKGYGIHGTNSPNSIGRAASHGCIRMRNRDIEQFFRMVSVGDTVEIRGERDAQIAEIFGGEVEATAITVAQAEASLNVATQPQATLAQVGGGQ